MTTANTPQTHPRALRRAVFFHCLVGILRAGRMIAAAAPPKWGQRSLIKSDQEQEQCAQNHILLRRGPVPNRIQHQDFWIGRHRASSCRSSDPVQKRTKTPDEAVGNRRLRFRGTLRRESESGQSIRSPSLIEFGAYASAPLHACGASRDSAPLHCRHDGSLKNQSGCMEGHLTICTALASDCCRIVHCGEFPGSAHCLGPGNVVSQRYISTGIHRYLSHMFVQPRSGAAFPIKSIGIKSIGLAGIEHFPVDP